MAHRSRTLMVGGLLAALALASPAHAADGRISFSGAIVEPTCAVSTGDVAWLVSGASTGAVTASYRSCDRAQAGANAGYELAVSTLSADRQADQLLSYFVGYARANGFTAHLVTQTYQ